MPSPLQPRGPGPLTSTQVSISGNWLMMGSTASMEPPGLRSDLLPTRMMGTLGRGPWSPGIRELAGPSLLPEPCLLPGSPLGIPVHQRDPFGSDLKVRAVREGWGPPGPQLPGGTLTWLKTGPLRSEVTATSNKASVGEQPAGGSQTPTKGLMSAALPQGLKRLKCKAIHHLCSDTFRGIPGKLGARGPTRLPKALVKHRVGCGCKLP